MTTVHIAHAVGSTGSSAPAYRVEIEVGAHHLVADEPAAAGGGDVGPSPFGLLLSGLAACTSTTLRLYAERKGWELALIEVDVRLEIDIDDNGRRSIARTITVPGDLSSEQRQQLAGIAERTPVTLAIRDGVPITTTFQPHNG